MILVCDSNVLISAFLFPGGQPDKILRAILSGNFRHATSPDILTELRRVFLKKFDLAPTEIEAIVTLLVRTGELVYPTKRIDVIKTDPADNRILECAEEARADAIISGDKKHLLKLRKFQSIPILSPSEFVVRAGLL